MTGAAGDEAAEEEEETVRGRSLSRRRGIKNQGALRRRKVGLGLGLGFKRGDGGE